tara:strand:+ start:324 stop:662 length:339 start_codon:yes stop_codon:yes gene_type:complete
MKQIDKLTAANKQNFRLTTEDGEAIEVYLYYNPSQETWNISIGFGDFALNGLQLVVSPNILRQYQNVLPFGIAVGSIDGQDPRYITDFVSNRVGVLLLTSEEVEITEGNFAA